MDTEAVALLRELVEAQHEQTGLLRQLVGQRGGTEAAMGLMFRAAFASLGTESFTLARLVELSKSPMRIALGAAVGGRSPHALAKLFAGNVGRTIDRMRLERVGAGRPAGYRLIDVDDRKSRPGHAWRV